MGERVRDRLKQWPRTLAVSKVLAVLVASVLGLWLLFGIQDIGGVVFGPPALWQRPWSMPSEKELAGQYGESSRTLDRSSTAPKAKLSLHEDGTMTVSDLPGDVVSGPPCLMTGKGRWRRDVERNRLALTLLLPEGPKSCGPGAFATLAPAGHGQPYSLFLVVGDPDEGQGVWLASNR